MYDSQETFDSFVMTGMYRMSRSPHDANTGDPPGRLVASLGIDPSAATNRGSSACCSTGWILRSKQGDD